ncbi:MAG TPA: type II toxin-antitoxin system prevent-host-death family antitoxin [Candidatus Eisenbacteria bacterium]|jgi:prevent-host-death family protein
MAEVKVSLAGAWSWASASRRHMASVRIADLKSQLSEYLRSVRRGHPLTVMDRDTPIARIVPYESEADRIVVRQPVPGSPAVPEVALPPPLRIRRDAVDLLLEERRTGR